MNVPCPTCGHEQKFDGSLALDVGARLRCLECGRTFWVNEPDNDVSWWVRREKQEVAEAVKTQKEVWSRIERGELAGNDWISKDGERWQHVALWMAAQRRYEVPKRVSMPQRVGRMRYFVLGGIVAAIAAVVLSRDDDNGSKERAAMESARDERIELAEKVVEVHSLESYEDAIDIFTEAYGLDAKHVPTLAALARVHLLWSDVSSLSSAQAHGAASRTPDLQQERQRMAHLERARKFAESAVRNAPFDGTAHLVLARVLGAFGEYRDAEFHLEEASRAIEGRDVKFTEAELAFRKKENQHAEALLSPYQKTHTFDATLVLLRAAADEHGLEHAKTRHPEAVESVRMMPEVNAWLESVAAVPKPRQTPRRIAPRGSPSNKPGSSEKKKVTTKKRTRRSTLGSSGSGIVYTSKTTTTEIATESKPTIKTSKSESSPPTETVVADPRAN